MNCLWMFPVAITFFFGVGLVIWIYGQYIKWIVDLTYNTKWDGAVSLVLSVLPACLFWACMATWLCCAFQSAEWHPPLVMEECQCATK